MLAKSVRQRILGILCALSIGALAALSPIEAESARAADGSKFDAGHIISDAIFHDAQAMAPTGIQSFLNAQVPNCAAGYTCLKNYSETTPTFGSDAYCAGYAGAANESAAQIIAKVAQSCRVNPQVILTILQKEQTLVTLSTPTQGRYEKAMGYYCTDSAPCNPTFAGFFRQVFYAARQFGIYEANPSSYRYRAGQANSVLYHPTQACGSSSVTIVNQATANLYIYTPYQPNAAALANLYGVGDNCSSYGNRNFWRIFSDWFGSPVIPNGVASLVNALYVDVLAREPSDDELYGWGRNVANGMPNGQVTGGFLTSDEYRLRRIEEAYVQVLERPSEPGAGPVWLNWIRSGAVSTEGVQMFFLASEEFLIRTGGTNETFAAAMYRRLLGREPIPDEVAGWAGVAAREGRGVAVDRIWNSIEATQRRVSKIYEEYLGRTPGGGETLGWAEYAIAYGDATLRGTITNSEEYSVRARSRFPGAAQRV